MLVYLMTHKTDCVIGCQLEVLGWLMLFIC